MSTPKIDLSPVDGTPTPSIVPTFIGHCPGSPCAVCGRIDLPAGTIAPPNTRPLCGMHFAEWRASTIIIRNVSPGAVFAEIAQAGPSEPVRDIREAMRPADEGFTFALDGGGIDKPRADATLRDPTLTDAERAELPGLIAAVEGPISTKGADAYNRLGALRLKMARTIVRYVRDDATVHVHAPHVATLPNGSRINLPAGTVLREGEEAIPEHPLFALVRSFVGKPGDKPGPVWTALMCVQARLGDDDMAGAILAANELEEALNERLGQMHDALGRDTAEGSR